MSNKLPCYFNLITGVLYYEQGDIFGKPRIGVRTDSALPDDVVVAIGERILSLFSVRISDAANKEKSIEEIQQTFECTKEVAKHIYEYVDESLDFKSFFKKGTKK